MYAGTADAFASHPSASRCANDIGSSRTVFVCVCVMNAPAVVQLRCSRSSICNHQQQHTNIFIDGCFSFFLFSCMRFYCILQWLMQQAISYRMFDRVHKTCGFICFDLRTWPILEWIFGKNIIFRNLIFWLLIHFWIIMTTILSIWLSCNRLVKPTKHASHRAKKYKNYAHKRCHQHI